MAGFPATCEAKSLKRTVLQRYSLTPGRRNGHERVTGGNGLTGRDGEKAVSPGGSAG